MSAENVSLNPSLVALLEQIGVAIRAVCLPADRSVSIADPSSHHAILDKLDQLIAVQRAACLPDVWLDAAGVGAILTYSTRDVRERLAVSRDFPRALRVDGKGNPRWKRSEVLAWAEKQRAKS